MSPGTVTLPSTSGFGPWDGTSCSRPLHGMYAREGQNVNGGPNNNGHPTRMTSCTPRFPNIKDLHDKALPLDIGEGTSIDTLLYDAQEAIKQAKALADRDQLSDAYVQYLRSSEITINAIPRHPEYRAAISERKGWHKQFANLMMAVRTKQGTMDDIKREIMEDNRVSGIKPMGIVSKDLPAPQVDISERGRQSDVGVTSRGSLRMPSPSEFHPTVDLAGKPNRFSTPVGDALAQRFARLMSVPPMASSQGTVSDQQDAVPSVTHPDNYPSRPSSQFLRGRYSISVGSPTQRPRGPRSMLSSSNVPTLSLKTPLSMSLPRAPDPAYSPVWTVPPSNPPRVPAENSRPINPRYSHILSSPRSGSDAAFDDNPYRSRTPNGTHSVEEARSRTADLPHDPTINASDLLDCIRKYNVLLIDVRSRDQFDSGHVYAKSVICIEPVALKENMSAEELEERLVLSPEYEQTLFEKRNEFDIVVYYDQHTDSVSYLAGSPVGTTAPHLRALYDTLYEFNAYKPLKDGRPPALLLGGLDAWIDLLGQQSLATSATAVVMGSMQVKELTVKTGRPLGRVPTVASANSSLEVRKRRLREFTPLNSEELTAWMEKTKDEEIETDSYTGEVLVEEPEENNAAESLGFIHSYEDFLRRFPEPHAAQQSMMLPRSQAPGLPAPNYSTPVPVAPSRPPPAVPRRSYSGVSEGRHAQPPLERQSSATKTALYVSSSAMDRLKLPRTGLTNFGVTCYMNSTIQCLSATIMLSRFFIDNRYRFYIQKNWKGSQGLMPGLYANLIRSLWKDDVEMIIPTSFRNFSGRLNREWAIDRQQDAKEFFDFIVDCLHEDLNINWQRTPLRPLTLEEEMQRERMPVAKVSRIEWDRYCHREESFISSLFAGQHASRLRCTTCKRTSTTYEAFYSISIEIPETGTGDIYQCLQSYCKEEMLSGDEVWKCPYCKCEREATKQIIITRAPQILVVHFKRFSASKTQRAQKVHTPIEFPLRGLKMDDFVISYPSLSNGDEITEKNNTAAPAATTPPFTYDAYAILRHIGTSMGSGHYVSLVRDAQRHSWRKFDDERVTDFNPGDLRYKDRLQNEQAYIVFYERAPAK